VVGGVVLHCLDKLGDSRRRRVEYFVRLMMMVVTVWQWSGGEEGVGGQDAEWYCNSCSTH
jgi:hypothetical protein